MAACGTLWPRQDSYVKVTFWSSTFALQHIAQKTMGNVMLENEQYRYDVALPRSKVSQSNVILIGRLLLEKQ